MRETRTIGEVGRAATRIESAASSRAHVLLIVERRRKSVRTGRRCVLFFVLTIFSFLCFSYFLPVGFFCFFFFF